MAKFLVATMPIPGHVLPVQPVVRRLIEQGHQVVWYGSRFMQAGIEASGARFEPIRSTLDFGDSDYNRHFSERSQLKGLAQLRFDFKHVFVDPIAGYLQDLREIQRGFGADVLLTDSGVAAAKILSHQDGLPWAALNISVLALQSADVAPFGLGLMPSATPLGRLRNRLLYKLVDRMIFRDVQRHYDAAARRHGWPIFPFRPAASPYLYLQPSLPSFEYPRRDLPPQVHFIGPLLPEPPRTQRSLPAWWDDVVDPRKTVVLVTQGTIATDAGQLLVPALQALAGEDVLVVATTGGPNAAQLGLAVPANARVEPFVPFTQLMPHVDILLTNGGYGGVSIALAHGVPVICAGTSEDKPEVCNRVAWSGLGINLKTATPSVVAIRDAVRQMRSDDRYRQRALAMQAEAARHDAPAEAARLLVQLAHSKQPIYAAMASGSEILQETGDTGAQAFQRT
jgi:UDP:flavonoid glycosyltransferase YjiC (YdhE family)